MKQLLEDVAKLVRSELDRACFRFGNLNNSSHEGYAVILEEYEEAEAELKNCKVNLDNLWDMIKRNKKRNKYATYQETLDTLQLRAQNLAAEAIQVAAMAAKERLSEKLY